MTTVMALSVSYRDTVMWEQTQARVQQEVKGVNKLSLTSRPATNASTSSMNCQARMAEASQQ